MKKIVLILIGTTQLSLMSAAPSAASSSGGATHKESEKFTRAKILFYSGHMEKIITLQLLQDILVERKLALEYYTSAHFPSRQPCPLDSKYITTKNESIVFFDTNKRTPPPHYSNIKTGCVILEYHLKNSLSFMIMKFTNTPTSQFVLNMWMSELQKQQASIQEAFKSQNYPKVVALLSEQCEKKRDRKGCINALLPYAEQGDAFAMFELSRHFIQDYLESKDTNQLKSAIQWFTRASIREAQDLSCHKKENKTLFCDSLSRVYYKFLTQQYNPSLFKASFEHYFKENLAWVRKTFESSPNTVPSPEWLSYWSDKPLFSSDSSMYLQPKDAWSSLRLNSLSNNNLMNEISFRMTHSLEIFVEEHVSSSSV